MHLMHLMSHHIIVKEKGNRQRSAKIWLDTFEVTESGTLTEKDLNLAIGLIKTNQSLLVDSFKKVKNGEKITTLKLK